MQGCPRRIACLLSCLFLILSGAALASSEGGIHVTVLNIRNSKGTVDCALFNSPQGFPADVLHSALKLAATKISNGTARCDFEGVPAGTYAVVVLHDENMNARIDYNWLGIPREGYGFSGDANDWLGAPSFARTSFAFDGHELDLTITLRYGSPH